MTRVLLLHSGQIPHYRVPIYNRLRAHLMSSGFDFRVASDGIQRDNPHAVDFPFIDGRLSTWRIAQIVYTHRIDVVILFVDMRHRYLFPTYLFVKGFLRRKMVWWGQGRDLFARDARLKNLAYSTEHALCDSIILYAEHLKKYVRSTFHPKVFVANNTLAIEYSGLEAGGRERVLAKYGIRTKKNIICVGRIQKRKRLDALVAAVAHMNRPDIGLILAGPDPDGVLRGFKGDNIYKIGPVYSDDKFDLLSASDVSCLPGAVGLSIVDALYCGLPFITDDGDESAEIMYLKDGVNGFVVPRGDIPALAEKLLLLLDDDRRRGRFSEEARREIARRGNIDQLCAGFEAALVHAVGYRPDMVGSGARSRSGESPSKS